MLNTLKKIHTLAKGFTLVELMVTIGLVAIMSTVATVTLNPAELLRQSRDSTRLSDLSTINTALGIISADTTSPNFGSSSVVYISIPDTSPTCANIPDLPALTSSTYSCASPENYKNTDGTGWVPLNLSNISFGTPLAQLPTDPINLTTCGLYYTYVPGWGMSAALQSEKYRAQSGNAGTSTIFIAGKTPEITPPELLNRACANGYSPDGDGGGDTPPDESSAISADYSEFTIVLSTTLPADGQHSATAYALIKDLDNQPIEGAEVQCLAEFDGVTVESDNPNLTASGEFSGWSAPCYIKSATVYPNLEISARARIGSGSWVNITQKAYVEFTLPQQIANSSISTDRLTAEADGVSTISWTLTARDTNNVPVENVSTNCDVVPPDGYIEGMTIEGDSSKTNAQGESTCTIKTTHQGVYELNFLMAGESVSGQTVEFTEYTPPELTISSSLSTIGTWRAFAPADDSTGITSYVKVLDTNGDPVEGATVDCYLTGTGNRMNYSGGSHLTNENGDMYCELFSTDPEVKTFSAVAHKEGYGASVTLDQQPEYTFSEPGDTANSEISFNRNSVPADGYSQVVSTITVRDEFNSPVPGTGITCYADPGEGVGLIGDGNVTDSNGQAICRFSYSSEASTDIRVWMEFGPSNIPESCTGSCDDFGYDIPGAISVNFYGVSSDYHAAVLQISDTETITGLDDPIIGQIQIVGADSNPVEAVPTYCSADPGLYVGLATQDPLDASYEQTPQNYMNVDIDGVTNASGISNCYFWTEKYDYYTLSAYSDIPGIGSILIGKTDDFAINFAPKYSTVIAQWGYGYDQGTETNFLMNKADMSDNMSITVTLRDIDSVPGPDGVYVYGTDTVNEQTYYSATSTGPDWANPENGVSFYCGNLTDQGGQTTCSIITSIPGTHTIKIYDHNDQQIGDNLPDGENMDITIEAVAP